MKDIAYKCDNYWNVTKTQYNITLNYSLLNFNNGNINLNHKALQRDYKPHIIIYFQSIYIVQYALVVISLQSFPCIQIIVNHVNQEKYKFLSSHFVLCLIVFLSLQQTFLCNRVSFSI